MAENIINISPMDERDNDKEPFKITKTAPAKPSNTPANFLYENGSFKKIQENIAIKRTLVLMSKDAFVAEVYLTPVNWRMYNNVTPVKAMAMSIGSSLIFILLLFHIMDKISIKGEAIANLKKAREMGGIFSTPILIAIKEPPHTSATIDVSNAYLFCTFLISLLYK